MHIGIDARLTHYRVGGISTYIRRLIGALEDLADQQDDFTIFRSRKSQVSSTTRFLEKPLWTPPHHRLERWALSAELARFRLDVLHSPDFIPPIHGAKHHVITIHDLTFLHYPQHKDSAALRYYNGQIKVAVKQADHILAVSEATKYDLIEMLNVPSRKITVQPHGVDEQFRLLSSQELSVAKNRLNLPEKFILHVGTLEPRKNIPMLLEAYLQLRNRLPDAPALVLVGHIGWLFEETQNHIETLQAQGHPIFIQGDIEDALLPAVYNLASILVMPSFYEGFGLPALEAMACGTPVIVSNNSSLPEVVDTAGILIDAHQPDSLTTALFSVLTDPLQHETMRQLGLERAKLFTWEQSAQIALSVYHALG